MPATVVIGGQWGDEGKGRIVDLLARDASVIARYSAGNNAGHTIINHLGLFALHLVPAGIFYPDKTCLIGNGLAIDPRVLIEEIDSLASRGVSTERLFVSDRAHVIMPYHPLIDQLDEKLRGAGAVGTTGRGVGPAFVDKVGRLGIRMGDLVDPKSFRDRSPSPSRMSTPPTASTRSGCGRSSATPPSSPARRWPAVRTCSWRAPRARSSTWTAAPTIMPRPPCLPQPPPARPSASASAPRTSPRSSASTRPT